MRCIAGFSCPEVLASCPNFPPSATPRRRRTRRSGGARCRGSSSTACFWRSCSSRSRKVSRAREGAPVPERLPSAHAILDDDWGRRATFRVFSVRCRHTRSPQSGRAHDFFVLEAPDRGNVVPVTPGGNLACVRQYRPGTEAVTLEIPAGCTAREVIPFGAVDPNPAIQSNACHPFLAAGAWQECTPTGRKSWRSNASALRARPARARRSHPACACGGCLPPPGSVRWNPPRGALPARRSPVRHAGVASFERAAVRAGQQRAPAWSARKAPSAPSQHSPTA